MYGLSFCQQTRKNQIYILATNKYRAFFPFAFVILLDPLFLSFSYFKITSAHIHIT